MMDDCERVNVTLSSSARPCWWAIDRSSVRSALRNNELGSRGPLSVSGEPNASEILRNQMTLGNGYLGSCIDEERSEMRYLV